MRSRTIALLLTTLATATMAASPRLTFIRTVSAPHDLRPAERVAVIYAIGDNDHVLTFVDRFVDTMARAGTLRIANHVENNHHLALEPGAIGRLRREHPADAYLGVNLFTCNGQEKSAEGSEHNVDGGRVRKTHHWVDATCTARIDVLGADGRKLFAYHVRGEGTSPRAVLLTEDERDVAYEQAARYAAVAAAEEITPRAVRESVELDDSAPAFDEGWAMIESERLADARAIWEASLRRHAASAALSYNLGAICEAMGDREAAHRYFEAAVKMSPKEVRYRNEFEQFRRRFRR